MTVRYATDIVTFYHPQFWGLASSGELDQWVLENPEAFWARVLDSLVEAGVSGLELTFAPGDLDSAVRAFGSAGGVREEFGRRGLSVVSAFVATSYAPDWRDPANLPAILADIERRAGLVAEMGGDLLVTSLPMRRTFGQRPPFFVDAPFLTRMADVAHQAAAAAQQYGVGLAVHTESNSTFWYERDIDLFLALTDPQYVSLCADSCHIALGGGDPVGVARRHASRIALAHWKDAVRPIDVHLPIDEGVFARQQPYMAELGQGIVDWEGWAEVMATTPGRDTVLIELDEALDPVASLRAGIDVVEGLTA